MNLSRRGFLQIAGITMAASAVPLWAKAAGNALEELANPLSPIFRNPLAWPVVQGPTDATSATFVVLHPRASDFRVRALGPGRQVIRHSVVEAWDLPDSSFTASEFLVTGLLPGLPYTLELEDGRNGVFDRRRFSSLDLAKDRCRFAIVSCMNDGYSSKAVSMWETLQRENCDFVVFLGDTCYADVGNDGEMESGYSRRYSETRSRLAWFTMPRLTPSFATWDDHDFGLNNADKSFRHKGFTQRAFRRFWGSAENSAWRHAHGVGSVFTGFGQRFFFMDDRSFRDEEGSRNGRHWGKAQTDWLLQELARGREPAWLMNGSQFFGGYLGKESFEGDHKGDLEDLLRSIKRAGAKVAFASGDVHFSELMEIEEGLLGYKTMEFTSSSMHSYTFPGHQHRAYNPRRLVSEWRHNFLVFDASAGRDWRIHVRCVTEGNRVSFERGVEI